MGKADLQFLEALVDRMTFLGSLLSISDIDTVFRKACETAGVGVWRTGWWYSRRYYTLTCNSNTIDVSIQSLKKWNGVDIFYIGFQIRGTGVDNKEEILRSQTSDEIYTQLLSMIKNYTK